MNKLHVGIYRPKLPTYLAISHPNYIALNSHSIRTWNSGRDLKPSPPTHYNIPEKNNLANAQNNNFKIANFCSNIFKRLK